MTIRENMKSDATVTGIEHRALTGNSAYIIFIILMIVTALVLPINVLASHEGGEGYCEGCHVLHQSDGGADTSMLIGSDPSSTCLRCHAESGQYYNVLSNDGSSYTPGGDFYWLTKTFTWNENSMVSSSEGDSHGHNIVALDYGLMGDSMLTFAPGDLYPSSAMGCESCHDPHGITDGDSADESVSASDNFRLLGGIGYNGGSQDYGITFNYPAPVAVADPDDWTETDTNHTAYGSGMSEWCSNCHSEFLNSGNKHPAGNNATLTSTIIANYNSYLKTGNFFGTQANAYTALIPFELGTSDRSLLNPSSMSGPGASGNPNVMCLTCHRAHASAFEAIGRWDFPETFIANSHPRAGDGGASGNDIINSYYGRDMTAQFGLYQRQLCNKCHVQD